MPLSSRRIAELRTEVRLVAENSFFSSATVEVKILDAEMWPIDLSEMRGILESRTRKLLFNQTPDESYLNKDRQSTHRKQ